MNTPGSPAPYNLNKVVIAAAKETEFDGPEFRKVEWITEISLGFLLLAVLTGFAIVCWDGVGYIYDSVFSVTPR